MLALVGLVWWCRRQELAGWWRWARLVAGGLAVLLLATGAVGAGINSYVGYFPTLRSFAAYVAGSRSGGLGGAGAAVPGGYRSRVVVDQVGAPALWAGTWCRR